MAKRASPRRRGRPKNAARKRKARYRLVQTDACNWLQNRKAKPVHAVLTAPPFALIEFEPGQLKKRASGSGGIWRLPQSFEGVERRPMPRFTVLERRDLAAILR